MRAKAVARTENEALSKINKVWHLRSSKKLEGQAFFPHRAESVNEIYNLYFTNVQLTGTNLQPVSTNLQLVFYKFTTCIFIILQIDFLGF